MHVKSVNVKGFAGFDICFILNSKRHWYLLSRNKCDLFDLLNKTKLPEGFHFSSIEANSAFGINTIFRLYHIPTLQDIKNLRKIITML